jgi:putative oxidoreductase
VQSRVLSILRIIVALLFIAHGTQKLFGFPPGAATWAGAPPPMSQMGVVGLLEAFGGVLLLVGLFTRPVAFLLCGEMAVAYFLRHAPKGFWPILNGGELAVLYCFTFLFFVAAGAGVWSLDTLLSRRRTVARPEPVPAPALGEAVALPLAANLVSCQEAFFADAHCRIDVERRDNPIGDASYVATMSVVDATSQTLRPLVFSDGARVAIKAASDALALSSALTYLEGRFGAFSEIVYGCVDATRRAARGTPLVVEAS